MSYSNHVRICRGRDCAKRSAVIEQLKESLADFGPIGMVKCQDMCKGPVVIVRQGKNRFWFKRVRHASLIEDLRVFIEEGSMTRQLVGSLAKKK
ncbi:MAG: hypothetical protein CMP23_04235 [Rickettsiales bacterium]|nr:hypothetical protein [Rickettsiales bacterium]